MFNRNVEVIIYTSLVNGENLKVSDIAEKYVSEGIIDIQCKGEAVKVQFITKKNRLKDLRKEIEQYDYKIK